MTVAATSLMAYRQFAPKDFGKKQSAILAFLVRKGPMTNKQLSQETGWPINCITPRIKELRDMGVVTNAGFRLDHNTNRIETVWMAKDLEVMT